MERESKKLTSTVDRSEMRRLSDVQGIDWTQLGSGARGRSYFRAYIDSVQRNFFNILQATPKFPVATAAVPNLITPSSFVRIPGITNYHFQLHNNFKSISCHDFIYSDNAQGLMHFNSVSMVPKVLLYKKNITSIDVKDGLILVAHEDNQVSLVDMEASKQIRAIQMDQEHDLINVAKFVREGAGLRAVVGGNNLPVAVYDLEKATKPVFTIPVEFYVNQLCLDQQCHSVAVVYDALQVEVFDLRSRDRTHVLHGHKDYNFTVDYHSNQTSIATGGQDCSTRIWDLRMNQCTHVLPSKLSASSFVKYLRNSSYLFVGENLSYMSCYSVGRDYQVGTTLDFFGDLVGADGCEETGELFCGIGNKYNDVNCGGILRLSVAKPPQFDN